LNVIDNWLYLIELSKKLYQVAIYIYIYAFKGGKEVEQLIDEMGEIPFEPLGIIYKEQN